MPVHLHHTSTGSGPAVVFAHEFGGDLESWAPQIAALASRYRCIAFNARGWPPSDVPEDPADYSQAHAADDIAAVLDAAGEESAHIVGLSMGGNAALHFAHRHPGRARSLFIGGVGYGALAETRAQFERDTIAFAERFETMPVAEAIQPYAVNPYRVQFQNKDPAGWAEFRDRFAAHDATGSALTLRGVLLKRPSIFDMGDELAAIDVPTLVYTGDEDEPCLEAALFMKRVMPQAGLWILPNTGHTVNLEEPDAFNRELLVFLDAVEAGTWQPRDPRSLGKSTLPDKA